MQVPLRIGLLFDSRFGWARNEVRGAIRYARAHRLPWLFAGGPDSSATRALLRRWRPDALLAARTGFESSQRFSTVFRKQTGETPGAYRASFRFNPGGHDRSAEAQPLRGRSSYA